MGESRIRKCLKSNYGALSPVLELKRLLFWFQTQILAGVLLASPGPRSYMSRSYEWVQQLSEWAQQLSEAEGQGGDRALCGPWRLGGWGVGPAGSSGERVPVLRSGEGGRLWLRPAGNPAAGRAPGEREETPRHRISTRGHPPAATKSRSSRHLTAGLPSGVADGAGPGGTPHLVAGALCVHFLMRK